jgi:alpha-tubulin suppressor-like RCC1 family protein
MGNDGFTTINLDPHVRAGAAVWEGLPEVVAIATGGAHHLLLMRDGSVLASGRNDTGQADVPGGLTDVIGIAAGFAHSLALRRDGTETAWVANARGVTDVPIGLSDVVALAGGGGHSVALKSDGTVVAWGELGDAPAYVCFTQKHTDIYMTRTNRRAHRKNMCKEVYYELNHQRYQMVRP